MAKMEYFPWSPIELERSLEEYKQGKIPVAYLELTAKCSFCNCLYCDSKVGCAYAEELTLDEIKQIILKLREQGLRWLFICGLGEPREEEGFFEILKFLKEQGIKVSFFTNGLGFNDGDIKLLKEYNANLILKLESFDEEKFDELLGGQGLAKRIYHFLDSLIKNDFVKTSPNNETNLALQIVPNKISLQTIPRVVGFCKEYNIFPAIGEMEHALRAKINWDKLKVTNEELSWLKKEVDKILGYSYERTLCQGIIPSLHINNIGEVTIDKRTGLSCGWFFQEDPENIVIGDIKKERPLVILQRMNKYRLERLKEIEKLLSDKNPIISSGGGTKPAKWYKDYLKIMDTLSKNETGEASN